MGLVCGVDLIEVERVAEAVRQHGERFLNRVYTPQELADCSGHVNSLAARFAAKEAVAKALGTGIGRVGWQEIEILRGPARQPLLRLVGQAQAVAQENRLSGWSISLSHTHAHAVALAVAWQADALP